MSKGYSLLETVLALALFGVLFLPVPPLFSAYKNFELDRQTYQLLHEIRCLQKRYLNCTYQEMEIQEKTGPTLRLYNGLARYEIRENGRIESYKFNSGTAMQSNLSSFWFKKDGRPYKLGSIALKRGAYGQTIVIDAVGRTRVEGTALR